MDRAHRTKPLAAESNQTVQMVRSQCLSLYRVFEVGGSVFAAGRNSDLAEMVSWSFSKIK